MRTEKGYERSLENARTTTATFELMAEYNRVELELMAAKESLRGARLRHEDWDAEVVAAVARHRAAAASYEELEKRVAEAFRGV
jgi:hypothetical protein